MVHSYETNSSTLSAKKQNYRSEPKMIYELEMKTCPKKIKEDDYIKDCKEQPRVISNQCDIQPLCDTQERMVRIYETNSFTLPAKEQIYRFEPKTIYELEMKTRPKKTKKNSYTKDCKEQPREICDQCDIQPLCDTLEQTYHFESKKTYELEMRTCPKTDSHIKDCKKQPREILPVKEQIYHFGQKKIYEL